MTQSKKRPAKKTRKMNYFWITLGVMLIGYTIFLLVIIPIKELAFDYRGVAYEVRVYNQGCNRPVGRSQEHYCNMTTLTDGVTHTVHMSSLSESLKYTKGGYYQMYQFRNKGVTTDGHVPVLIVYKLAIGTATLAVVGARYLFRNKRYKKKRRA